MAEDITLQLQRLAAEMSRPDGRGTLTGAATEIVRLRSVAQSLARGLSVVLASGVGLDEDEAGRCRALLALYENVRPESREWGFHE